MTAPVPIIDPDLEEAIQALGLVEARIRQIDSMIEDPDQLKRYTDLMRMKHERADLLDMVRAHATKLNLDYRALQLIVREAERVRSKANGRRHVSLDKLLTLIEAAAEYARIERAELNTELVFAKVKLEAATHRSAGLARAVQYLEASRAG